jgi:hypothetical protein
VWFLAIVNVNVDQFRLAPLPTRMDEAFEASVETYNLMV